MNRLTRGQLILGISSLVLLIALFLPWENLLSVPGGEFFGVNFEGQTITQSGLAGLGWLVFLLIIGLFVWEGLVMFGAIRGNFNPALIAAAIGGAIAAFALIQFLLSLGGIAWGAFVGLIALLGVAYGAWLRYQESRSAIPPTSAAPPTAPPPAP